MIKRIVTDEPLLFMQFLKDYIVVATKNNYTNLWITRQKIANLFIQILWELGMTDDEIIDFVENSIECREDCPGAQTDTCKLKKFVGACYAEYLKQNQKEKGVNNEKFI